MGASAAGSRRGPTRENVGVLERSSKFFPCPTGSASLDSHPTVAAESLFLKPIKEKILHSRFSQTPPLSINNRPQNTPAPKVLRGSKGNFSKSSPWRSPEAEPLALPPHPTRPPINPNLKTSNLSCACRENRFFTVRTMRLSFANMQNRQKTRQIKAEINKKRE